MRKKLSLLGLFVLAAFWSLTVAADDVVLDDLIINGSGCLGLDCNNGESFGFDTLRLKENNLRIRFVDTSSTGSFPTNDWQLVANDSANGGDEHFSIEDVDGQVTPFSVRKGAAAHALYVAERGIGMGTNQPEQAVHVSTSDTPVVRLEQTAAAGWPDYSWEVGANESSFFVRDESTSTIPFRIVPGADSDTFVIEAGGDVTVTGTVNMGSSREIKDGFQSVDVEDVLDRVAGLEISRWQYQTDPRDSQHLGPMAEDFHEAFGLGQDAQHLAPTDLAGVAVASVQALRSKVISQQAEIERLRRESAAREARLVRLEAMLRDH